MGQIATTIRMDSELKNKFDRLCEEFGMSINTAFNVFAKAVVRSRSIPFKIEAETDDEKTSGAQAFAALRKGLAKDPELSLAEINEEINSYRATKK